MLEAIRALLMDAWAGKVNVYNRRSMIEVEYKYHGTLFTLSHRKPDDFVVFDGNNHSNFYGSITDPTLLLHLEEHILYALIGKQKQLVDDSNYYMKISNRIVYESKMEAKREIGKLFWLLRAEIGKYYATLPRVNALQGWPMKAKRVLYDANASGSDSYGPLKQREVEIVGIPHRDIVTAHLISMQELLVVAKGLSEPVGYKQWQVHILDKSMGVLRTLESGPITDVHNDPIQSVHGVAISDIQ